MSREFESVISGPPGSLIKWSTLDHEAWDSCLDATLRYAKEGHQWVDRFKDKSIVLLFLNSSLRTRCSMELAATQLGGHVTTLQTDSGMWGLCFEDGVRMDGMEAEHVREAAGVLSTYYDAIGLRAFAGMTDRELDRKDHTMRAFANAAHVPVVNMESAFAHPCQALADAGALMSQFAQSVKNKRFVLTWAYHPRALPMAVPNSTLLMAARLGFDVTVARPDGYELDSSVMQEASLIAHSSGGSVTETNDQYAACEDAHVVYAKAWAGHAVYEDAELEAAARQTLKHWCVTDDLMKITNDGKFMHCLPVRRNVVVEDSVLDGPSALHMEQAAFRIHAQKAILERCWSH